MQLQGRVYVVAGLEGVGAAGVEGAAGWPRRRVWRVAGQAGGDAPGSRVSDHGEGADQGFRVGVAGCGEELGGGAFLDDASGVHY